MYWLTYRGLSTSIVSNNLFINWWRMTVTIRLWQGASPSSVPYGFPIILFSFKFPLCILYASLLKNSILKLNGRTGRNRTYYFQLVRMALYQVSYCSFFNKTLLLFLAFLRILRSAIYSSYSLRFNSKSFVSILLVLKTHKALYSSCLYKIILFPLSQLIHILYAS